MILRSNTLENDTQLLINKRIKIEEIYQDHFSAVAIENIKKHSGENKLFYDACSPYLTPKGNQRRTEFVLHCPMYNINMRIECKSQITDSNILARIYDELDFVTKINEDKLYLILGGACLQDHVLFKLKREIRLKELEDRVWFGSLAQFDFVLQRQIMSTKRILSA